MADKFVPPTTLEEAVRRRTEAVEKMQDIQGQLSQRNRLDSDGQRMPDREYQDWRGRAVVALRHKTAEVRQLNVAIKAFNVSAAADRVMQTGVDPKDPTSLIHAANILLRKLRSEGVDFDEAELMLLDALRELDAWLQAGGQDRPGWRESISRAISTLEALVQGTVVGVAPPRALHEARQLAENLEIRLLESERARLETESRASRAEADAAAAAESLGELRKRCLAAAQELTETRTALEGLLPYASSRAEDINADVEAAKDERDEASSELEMKRTQQRLDEARKYARTAAAAVETAEALLVRHQRDADGES